jgi:hypothetical protein
MKATDDPLTFIIALTFIVALPIVRYCVMIDCDDIPSVLLQSYIRATLLRTLIAYALPMGTTHGGKLLPGFSEVASGRLVLPWIRSGNDALIRSLHSIRSKIYNALFLRVSPFRITST